MDSLLKTIINASGISGFENEIAGIMKKELAKRADEVFTDDFGNVIAKKGKGGKKIMLAAHMDEIGLMVKHISKDGFLNFIKVGGIDDRVLPAQRVVVKAKKGDVCGVIGAKPPHLLKEEERKSPLKYDDMFIDIGARTREEAEKIVSVGDACVFEPNAGVLRGDLYYGKAVDDRVGCYVLLKAMEEIKADAEVYAVATVQEEVGLKGARTSSFRIAPDYAIVIDTTVSGDSPGIKETESALKLGDGVSITLIEAAGRGVIVNQKMKDLMIGTAVKNKIKHQIDVIEGGMTDGAMIYMNREGILTGVLSVPARYIHAPTGVFDIKDVRSAIALVSKLVPAMARI